MRSRAIGLYLFVFVMAVGASVGEVGDRIVGVAPAMAAMDPDELLEDPVLEERARSISKELRCLVCQNQSIDDSDADLARDLRQLVRERLLAGDSDEEIIQFATDRYGDFVLLRPPMKPSTWVLWYGPLVILLLAGAGMFFYVRRRRGEPVDVTAENLSAEEQAKLDDLLGRQGPEKT